MNQSRNYVGLEHDLHGGMTPIGKLIRDAWVFGILPEGETCRQWSHSQLDVLMQKVNNEWDRFGCLVSQLPSELFERHQRIHGDAFEQARRAGWSGELELHSE